MVPGIFRFQCRYFIRFEQVVSVHLLYKGQIQQQDGNSFCRKLDKALVVFQFKCNNFKSIGLHLFRKISNICKQRTFLTQPSHLMIQRHFNAFKFCYKNSLIAPHMYFQLHRSNFEERNRLYKTMFRTCSAIELIM